MPPISAYYVVYRESEWQLALAEFQRDLQLWAYGLDRPNGYSAAPPNFPQYSLDARIRREIRRTYGVN